MADPTIVKEYHISETALWTGTQLEAEEASRWDNDVYLVTKVLAHRGNIYVKTHMEFLLEYKDGDTVWMVIAKWCCDRVCIRFNKLLILPST